MNDKVSLPKIEITPELEEKLKAVAAEFARKHEEEMRKRMFCGGCCNFDNRNYYAKHPFVDVNHSAA